MEHWKHSKMSTIFYDDAESYIDEPCEVIIDGNLIVVKYDWGSKNSVEYSGWENGEGHYELKCPSLNGTATLHQFKNGRVLEGSWREENTQGMWRIALIKQAEK